MADDHCEGGRVRGRAVGNYVQVGRLLVERTQGGEYVIGVSGPDIATGRFSVLGVVLDLGDLLDWSDSLRHVANLP